ncbi:Bifunctional inhibitor/plant lipid transfer protein/seed storage helical domain [Sesbania bispinosa]|nr:Bifunctional inhibitor/plant lipid transfer protein/seed storage helical domain [Sesbania bispinosa]
MARRFLDYTMLVLVATNLIVLGNLVPSIAGETEAVCAGNLVSILSECKNFIKKEGKRTPPSKTCCSVLQGADVPCLCQYINPFIERYISVEKSIYVAKTCGCKIPPPGSKCGSYTVPPFPSPPKA